MRMKLIAIILSIIILISIEPVLGDTNSPETVRTSKGHKFDGVSWHPSSGEALVIAKSPHPGYEDLLYRYNGSDLEEVLSGNIHWRDVAWRPDGSYALLVGHVSKVGKYDGEDLVIWDAPRGPEGWADWLLRIAWKPDGSEALIVGDTGHPDFDSTAILFNATSETLTRLDISGYQTLEDVAWRPDGAYALIIASYGKILQFRNNVVTDISYPDIINWWSTVTWKPDDNLTDGYDGYALFAGLLSNILKYDGDSYEYISNSTHPAIVSTFGSTMHYNDIAWKPNGNYSVLVGYAHGGGGIVVKYDKEGAKLLYHIQEAFRLENLGWNPSGSVLLIGGSTHNSTENLYYGYLYRITSADIESVSSHSSQFDDNILLWTIPLAVVLMAVVLAILLYFKWRKRFSPLQNRSPGQYEIPPPPRVPPGP